MPLRQITPQSQVNQHLENELRKRERSILKVLHYVGMTCIEEARNNGDYIDQSGNLRSSIGYVILKNGVSVDSFGFQKVKGGDEGVKEGKKFIESLTASFSQGYVLILVAGMNYAAYVETKRNVLASSEIVAKWEANKLLTQLGFQRR